jgi:hypothetical protein
MARKKEYIATQVATQPFERGMFWGRRGIFRGNLCVEQSEEGIVEIIQNLIDFALEGHLTEELLRQDVVLSLGLCLVTPKFLRF